MPKTPHKSDRWDDWERENDFLAQEDEAGSYYEQEVLPRLERQAQAEKAKCQHDKFFIYCSSCKHVIGSESNDPYEVLRAHKAKHLNNE